jgi:hypothetical protein
MLKAAQCNRQGISRAEGNQKFVFETKIEGGDVIFSKCPKQNLFTAGVFDRKKR